MRVKTVIVFCVAFLFASVCVFAVDDNSATLDFARALASGSILSVPSSFDSQVLNCLEKGANIRNIDGFNCNSRKLKIQVKYRKGTVSLPSVPSGVQGSQLKIVSLKVECDNDCTASFPSTWVSMSQLNQLEFDDFDLTGTVPCDWTPMTSLQTLTLSEGSLYGSLPTFNTQMRNLKLEKNSFCGPLPASWSDLYLNNFDMKVTDTDRLCGCVPTPVTNVKLRNRLNDLGFDKRTGCHKKNPKCDGTCPSCGAGGGGSISETPTLRFLRLLGSAFRPLYNSWTGDNWQQWSGVTGADGNVIIDLSGTPLRGALPQLPSDLDGSAVGVKAIDLSGSMTVVGTLPASWGRLTQLQKLTLSRTGLSGTLPEQWNSMASLKTLEMTNTLICGALPDWTMQNLTTVDLSHNTYLRGSLASSWGTMPSLSTTRFTDNTYCGSLPSTWKTLNSPTPSNEYCTYALNTCRRSDSATFLQTILVFVSIVAVTTLAFF